ncbi:MAG: MoaD/ThiS family protein [Acidimicrobiales bacterium]
MVTLRLFAQAREAAGTNRLQFDEAQVATVGDVIDQAILSVGGDFSTVVGMCRIWRNGEQAERTDAVATGDEVALLPPVSGG